MKQVTGALLATLACVLGGPSAAWCAAPLSLADALALIDRNHPELVAPAGEVAAADARRRDAGQLDNPELSLQAEDFAGKGQRRGYSGAQTTLQLSQPLPLGGRLQNERLVAEREYESARAELQERRVAVLADGARTYMTAIAEMQKLRLAQDAAALAGETLQEQRRRFDARQTGLADFSRAEVQQAMAMAKASRAEGDLAAARRQLTRLWGGAPADADSLTGTLPEPVAPPPLDAALSTVDETPAVRQAMADLSRANAALALERSRQVPDVTVSAGVRRYQDDDSNALVMGLSAPLPLFKSNSGAVAAAGAKVAQAEARLLAVRRQAEAAMRDAHARMDAARRELTLIRGTLVPAIDRALAAATEAAEARRGSTLDVLEIRRDRLELREREVDLILSHVLARIDLDAAMGLVRESPL